MRGEDHAVARQTKTNVVEITRRQAWQGRGRRRSEERGGNRRGHVDCVMGRIGLHTGGQLT